MPILRDQNGKFVKGNSYWSGRKDKKPNKGSFAKGQEPWNKGKQGTYKLNVNRKGVTRNTGRTHFAKGMKPWNYGKDSPGFRGENNPNWRGGISSQKKIEWSKREARAWRKAVLNKDNYRCVLCGANEKLHCDHIMPQFTHPQLKYEVSNGRVLCFDCHKKTNTYGSRVKHEV